MLDTMKTEPKPTRQKGQPSMPASFALDLERFSMALALIARVVPKRTTMRQVTAVALVAAAHAAGRSITLTDLQVLGGQAADGLPLIRQTIERTLDPFRERTHREPEALGWISSEEDPDDRRRKYLKLTDDGVSALINVISALKGDCP